MKHSTTQRSFVAILLGRGATPINQQQSQMCRIYNAGDGLGGSGGKGVLSGWGARRGARAINTNGKVGSGGGEGAQGPRGRAGVRGLGGRGAARVVGRHVRSRGAGWEWGWGCTCRIRGYGKKLVVPSYNTLQPSNHSFQLSYFLLQSTPLNHILLTLKFEPTLRNITLRFRFCTLGILQIHILPQILILSMCPICLALSCPHPFPYLHVHPCLPLALRHAAVTVRIPLSCPRALFSSFSNHLNL